MGMRPSIGSSGMGISSGNSGSSRSTSVSVNQGGVTVGINIGIAEVGVTTDYGGGGKIGFGGQSVTWGLEGGKIQMGIAGFELIVEARNCVVTEIKKIAGQVVSSRTYPDPGCKEEEEKPENKPLPPPFDPEKGLELTDGTDLVYVFVDSKVAASVFQSSSISGLSETDEHHLSYKFTVSQVPEIVPAYSAGSGMPFKVTSKFEGARNIIKNRPNSPSYYTQSVTVKNDNEWSLPQGDRLVSAPTQFPGVFYTTKLSSNSNIQRTCNINGVARPINECSSLSEGPNPFIIYGSKTNCKTFLEYIKKKDTNTTSGTVYYYSKDIRFSHPISYIIPVGTVPKPKPLEGGNRPPMNSSCCKAILADLEDLKEVLAVKEIKAGKVSIPGELISIPKEGDPALGIEILKNYAQISNAQFLAITRYGFDSPITAVIKDSDLTKKGNQEDSHTYNSPSVALQAILEMLLESKAEANARLQIQVKLAYVTTRILKIVAQAGEAIQWIIKALGIRWKPATKPMPLEFNLSAAKKGGYGKPPRKGEKKQQPSSSELEAMLIGLLEDTSYDIPSPKSIPGDDDIRQLLTKILLAVQSK